MGKIDVKRVRNDHPDLRFIEGTIGNVFYNNKDAIFQAFDDPNIDTEEYRQMILSLIAESKDPDNEKIIYDFENDRDKLKLLEHFSNFLLASQDEALRSPDSSRNSRYKTRYNNNYKK